MKMSPLCRTQDSSGLRCKVFPFSCFWHPCMTAPRDGHGPNLAWNCLFTQGRFQGGQVSPRRSLEVTHQSQNMKLRTFLLEATFSPKLDMSHFGYYSNPLQRDPQSQLDRPMTFSGSPGVCTPNLSGLGPRVWSCIKTHSPFHLY